MVRNVKIDCKRDGVRPPAPPAIDRPSAFPRKRAFYHRDEEDSFLRAFPTLQIGMSIDDINKKKARGRPFADTEAVTVRVSRTFLAQVDNWRSAQLDKPSRPEAIRRLAAIGIKDQLGLK